MKCVDLAEKKREFEKIERKREKKEQEKDR